jgi:hypothetical protein
MQHSMGWYIADLLEKPIPKETINTFFNFYRFGCVSRLTSEQVSDLVDLTIRCYTMLFEKKIIFEEDRDAIHSDMVQKIVKILFCHENYRASRLFKVCAILSNFLNSVRRFIRK